MSFDVQEYAKKERDMYTELIEASKKKGLFQKKIKVTGMAAGNYKFVDLHGGFYVSEKHSHCYLAFRASDIINKRIAHYVTINTNFDEQLNIQSITHKVWADSLGLLFKEENPEGIISNLVYMDNGDLTSITTSFDGSEIITIEEAQARIDKQIAEKGKEIKYIQQRAEKEIQIIINNSNIAIQKVEKSITDLIDSKARISHSESSQAVLTNTMQFTNIGARMIELEAIARFRNRQ